MKVGCYTLDLYCDVGLNEAHREDRIPSCGWRKDMEQFTGRTKAECLRDAKAKGWIVGTKDRCPKHAKERRRS